MFYIWNYKSFLNCFNSLIKLSFSSSSLRLYSFVSSFIISFGICVYIADSCLCFAGTTGKIIRKGIAHNSDNNQNHSYQSKAEYIYFPRKTYPFHLSSPVSDIKFILAQPTAKSKAENLLPCLFIHTINKLTAILLPLFFLLYI